MTIGILGLGLIGGSLARAYSQAGHTVLAYDMNMESFSAAQSSGVVKDTLSAGTVGQCDFILLAIFPDGSADWLARHAAFLRKETLVMDCCGTKVRICSRCFPIAQQYGFSFIGGHPMAGTQFSGFFNSKSDLFLGQPMVLVPPEAQNDGLIQRAKEMLRPCGFGSFSVTTAEAHDRLIAFTSQMAHIVSNAYIKSPTALHHQGFSAGSYKDLTRVAWLNPQMWAELFLDNRDNILTELDFFINNLNAYRNAILERNAETLTRLLDEGRNCKAIVDGSEDPE